MARLVLGDEHVVFLDALSTVLTQHGYEISPVARSAAEMVTLVRRDQPDVCVIDRHAALDDDVATIGRVRAASDSTNVLVLSANPDPEAAGRALDAGASGYLHQSRGVGELVGVLERVLQGEVVVDVPDARPPLRRPAQPNQALRLAGHLTSGAGHRRHDGSALRLAHDRADAPAGRAHQARRALTARGRVLRRAPRPSRPLVLARKAAGRRQHRTADPAPPGPRPYRFGAGAAPGRRGRSGRGLCLTFAAQQPVFPRRR